MKTADDYRAAAAENRAEAADSWERSDTDGFVSQWASGISAEKNEMRAILAENDGKAEFPALFDTEGNLVAAKYIETRYGYCWGILESDDPSSTITSWFSPSSAQTESRRIAADAKKGYYVGTVRAEAGVGTNGGNGRGLSGALTVYPVFYRKDRGFSREVEVVDNGK